MEQLMTIEGAAPAAPPPPPPPMATPAAAAAVDPNSVETYQPGLSQGYTYPYYPPGSVSTPASWPTHGGDHSGIENGSLQNYSYQYHQQPASSVQDGTAVASLSSTSAALGTDNASHLYTNYATYPTSTNQYGYVSAEYSNYYTGYQQQPNQQHSQAQGAYQNSGSPYQPISSFQNSGSYAAPTSYTSTYYNPGDYQTTGAYTGSSYSSQTNTWSQGNYTNYTPQYASYSHESSSTYSSSTAAAATDYQQQYKQWADYYSSQTEVTCAPGTETTAVTNTATMSSAAPGVSAGYTTPVSLPQPSYTTTWKSEPSPAVPSTQTGSTVGLYDDYWKHAPQAYPNQHVTSSSPSFQKPLDLHLTYPSGQDQQQTAIPQVPSTQYMEVQQAHQQSLEALPPTELYRVSNLQIPTNPRIVSNLNLGTSKPVKDTSMSSVTAKPAYVSVSLPNQNIKTPPTSASDSSVKPGVFPAALRGYVERALARCKDEKQRAACQEVMKEIITKATDDGTLHSRDWDTQPLFPLPDTSTVNNEQSASPFTSLSMFKRSPSRRTKSRWEPLPEEKLVEKPSSTYQDSVKQGGWAPYNGRDLKQPHIQFHGGNAERKDVSFSKFSTVERSSAGKSANRPAKRRRFGSDINVAENGEASSDSDKEQSLTAYYSAAATLADSPEERKRRENRSKRFEKGNSQKAENRFRPKNAGARNLYARRATALVLNKTSEDGGSRAVEDIDWDALTVKGTCQDIEKRYLRLTSAPDPSTVRPQEVLERALLMVKNSEKNYLYKCDQLKSIRQDLTVQRIRNELTVQVYETHARLSLEYGDLPEFNQCLSQLKSLYSEGNAGCQMEFSAYHLLSVILHSNNRRELISSMSRLSVEARSHEAVKHALSVRASVTSGNYVLFFRLYKTAPNLNTCLMDLCVEKIRFEAVQCMSRAYRPSIPISFIAQVLGFSNALEDGDADEKDVEGCDECTEWLRSHGACLIPDSNGELVLDSKASSTSLYMPEPEDAVAHGDANLDVNDFFTRTAS
ncbi:SAC3 family protein A isoform X1 [Silene latifolia]|uniref:SAC3 family protein A isoform X1 n=1 Tax=Silene latifolia TaxID=37657 RepID=UPI003D78990D